MDALNRLFERDTVKVLDNEEVVVRDSISANVENKLVTISDVTVPIKPGYVIIRELPNGIVEKYLVIDPGYTQGVVPGMPPQWQIKVRRKDALPTPPASVTYSVIGIGAKLNIGTYDASHTTIVYNQGSPQELFDGLREAAAAIVGSDRELIAESIAAMEVSLGKPTFLDRYKDFMALAASHVTVFTPFYAALASLLPHAK